MVDIYAINVKPKESAHLLEPVGVSEPPPLPWASEEPTWADGVLLLLFDSPVELVVVVVRHQPEVGPEQQQQEGAEQHGRPRALPLDTRPRQQTHFISCHPD